MTEQMRAALTEIAEREGESSVEVLEDGLADFYGLIDNDEIDVASVSPGLDDQRLPDGYLDCSYVTATQVRDYLDTVAVDWRVESYDVVIDRSEEVTR